VQDLRFRAKDLRKDAKLTAPCGRAQAAGAGRDRARSWSIRGSKARRKHGIAIVVVPLAVSADPQCRRLVCFVYDPEGRIANPVGIENDLNSGDHGIEVRVSILPKAAP
jgi:hypothetical protein